MATVLVTKNSVTATSVPTISDIIQGEIAINLTDGYLFSRDESNNIVEFGIIKQGGSNTNTPYFDGTNWLPSAALSNDGTDIGVANDLAVVGALTAATVAAAFTGDGSAITAVNAATLDSLDSLQFLRSDAVDIKTSGNLTFADGVSLNFGTGDDWALAFGGTDLVFNGPVTGDFDIQRDGTSMVNFDMANTELDINVASFFALEVQVNSSLRLALGNGNIPRLTFEDADTVTPDSTYVINNDYFDGYLRWFRDTFVTGTTEMLMKLNDTTGDLDLTAGKLMIEGTMMTTNFKYMNYLTQAAYDALTPESNTMYFING